MSCQSAPGCNNAVQFAEACIHNAQTLYTLNNAHVVSNGSSHISLVTDLVCIQPYPS
ncbi:unnamed protein product, partial [Staurois parvus]